MNYMYALIRVDIMRVVMGRSRKGKMPTEVQAIRKGPEAGTSQVHNCGFLQAGKLVKSNDDSKRTF